jgi:hypothetical protein
MPDLPPVPQKIAQDAKNIADASSPYEAMINLATNYRNLGYYSDGDEEGGVARAGGHSVRRLEDFFGHGGVVVGNAEQYAAAFALTARAAGLPARVVLGFKKTKATTTVLRRRDTTAWVEVSFEHAGWVAFNPTPDETKTPPKDIPPQPKPQRPENDVASPPRRIDPPVVPPELQRRRDERDREEVQNTDGSFTLPAWLVTLTKVVGLPCLVLAMIAAAIVGLKRWRRHRRRTRGSPIDRLAGAWREATDRVRDHGAVLPRRATRSEVASAVGSERWPGGRAFASMVDGAMFARAVPDEGAVATVWRSLDADLADLRREHGRGERARAALSLRSLRGTR